MRKRTIFCLINYIALGIVAACSAATVASSIIRFQENAPPSNNSQQLIGHWRKTTISYTGPIKTSISSFIPMVLLRIG